MSVKTGAGERSSVENVSVKTPLVDSLRGDALSKGHRINTTRPTRRSDSINSRSKNELVEVQSYLCSIVGVRVLKIEYSRGILTNEGYG